MNWNVTYLLEAHIGIGPDGPDCALASARYRALLPGRELAAMGHKVHFADGRTAVEWANGEESGRSIVIVGKSFDQRTLETARRAKSAGQRVVVDFCDDHFAKPDIGAHFRALAAMADDATASTEGMATVLRRETGRPATVIPDPVESPRRQPGFEPGKERLNICWFGHPTNLDTLGPLFSELERHLGTAQGFLGKRSIRFEIVTELSDALIRSLTAIAKRLGGRVKLVATPWSPRMTWDALARCDIVMIPSIERADKSVKSPNRLLEAINAGRVTLAHPLPSHVDFSDCAFIEQDLWAALERALANAEDALARVRRGQAKIDAGFTPGAIARRWLSIVDPIARPDSSQEIVRAESEAAPAPIRLNLGCGDKILPGYVNVDVAPARRGQKPDVICDIRQLSAFPADHADEVLAVHVVEHLWRWEVADILKEWGRVLKPGGRIILECPNLISACQALLADPINASGPGLAGQRTMWVFYGDPAWKDPLMCHRWAYTPQSLGEVMAEAGFVNIRQEPAQFKLREPRDMRVVGEKPLAQAISTAG